METSFVVRLGAHERALMNRCAMGPAASRGARAGWTIATHLGGAGPSLVAAGLPWLACCALHEASSLALATLILSHLLVQTIKRTVVRSRPAIDSGCAALVHEPDRFSFPSGHATASMSVAMAYGAVFPDWAFPLLIVALVVGFSRVRLGVHYPSDVVAGQLIAAVTAALVRAVS